MVFDYRLEGKLLHEDKQQQRSLIVPVELLDPHERIVEEVSFDRFQLVNRKNSVYKVGKVPCYLLLQVEDQFLMGVPDRVGDGI